MTQARAEISLQRPNEQTILARFSGRWCVDSKRPSAGSVLEQFETTPRPERIAFDTQSIEAWDSGLLTFLLKVIDACDQHNIAVDRDGLPDGVRRLLQLARATPPNQARHADEHLSLLSRIGNGAVGFYSASVDMLEFLGESIQVLFKFARGKARFRRCDLMTIIQECGADALPIVTLINVLVGLILAFVGAIQLEQFGAQIFVADLVGIATTREMAAMMTGIIMAGRTGAAFAAQLGTMTVNEEVDALTTMGISRMEFLVLPRMIALAVMMPLLCLYADLMGIIGGFIVGVGMLDLTPTQYVLQTQAAVGLDDLFVGLFKGAVFGVLVALAGCFRGINCGRSASAVGSAATSAVVTGIVLIIVSDAIFAVVTNIVGI